MHYHVFSNLVSSETTSKNVCSVSGIIYWWWWWGGGVTYKSVSTNLSQIRVFLGFQLVYKKLKAIINTFENYDKYQHNIWGRGRTPWNWKLSLFSTVTHVNLKKNRLVAWTLASGRGLTRPPSQKAGGDVPPEKQHLRIFQIGFKNMYPSGMLQH